ncbi:hypothetical protein ACLBWT_16825, partial [Paenibacillus sp. D51F]
AAGSARERAAALAPALEPQAAAALQRLAAWEEAARFGPPAAAWSGPAPGELAAAAALLLARPAAGAGSSGA